VSILLPDYLEFALNLIGFNWPDADEDKLREAATAWRNFGRDVDDVRRNFDQIVTQVAQNNTGEAIDAFVALSKQYQSGDGGHLHTASMAATIVADVLEGFADAVVTMKIAVIAQLGILAGEVVATQGAAIFTLGLAEAALPEEIGLTQLVVNRIKHQLIQIAEQEMVSRFRGWVQEHLEGLKGLLPPDLQPLMAMAAAGGGGGGGRRRRGHRAAGDKRHGSSDHREGNTPKAKPPRDSQTDKTAEGGGRNTPAKGLGGRTLSHAEQAEFDAFEQRAKTTGLTENAFRTGSWGKIVDGKFQEMARIDVAESGKPGWRGKTHIHISGQKGHLDPSTKLPGEA
jgi:hypothetical protein